MKKLIPILLIIFSLSLLTACGDKEADTSDDTDSTDAMVVTDAAETESESTDSDTEDTDTAEAEKPKKKPRLPKIPKAPEVAKEEDVKSEVASILSEISKDSTDTQDLPYAATAADTTVEIDSATGAIDCSDGKVGCFAENILTCTLAISNDIYEDLVIKWSISGDKEEKICKYSYYGKDDDGVVEVNCEFPFETLSTVIGSLYVDLDFTKTYCTGDYEQFFTYIEDSAESGKRDTERKTEIGTLSKSINQYDSSLAVDKSMECLLGATPATASIPECDTDASGIGVGNGGFEGAIELGSPAKATIYDCSSLLVPEYIKEMPADPDLAYDATATGYWICQDTTREKTRIYIIAEAAEFYTDDGGCEVPGTTTDTMCYYY